MTAGAAFPTPDDRASMRESARQDPMRFHELVALLEWGEALEAEVAELIEVQDRLLARDVGAGRDEAREFGRIAAGNLFAWLEANR